MFFGCLPCCGGGCPSYQDILATETPLVDYTIGILFSGSGGSNFSRTYSTTSSSVQNNYQTLPGDNTSFEPYEYRVRVAPSSAGLSPLLTSFGIAYTLESALIVSLDVRYSGVRLSTLRLFVIPCGSVHQGNENTLLHGASAAATPLGVRFFNTPHQFTSVYSSAYGGQNVTGNETQPGYSFPYFTISVGNDFAFPIGAATWTSPLASLSTSFIVGPVSTTTYEETISFSLNGISSSIGNYYPLPASPESEVVFSAVQSSF